MGYSKLTIPMLKERLREAGLRVGGRKDEMMKRWKELPEDRRIQIASSPRVRAADLSHARTPASGASGALASTALRCVVQCRRDDEIATLRRDLELAHAHAAREHAAAVVAKADCELHRNEKHAIRRAWHTSSHRHSEMLLERERVIAEQRAEIASLRTLADDAMETLQKALQRRDEEVAPTDAEKPNEVSLWNHPVTGKTYLVDKSDNMLYDAANQNPVGIWNPETENIDEIDEWSSDGEED